MARSYSSKTSAQLFRDAENAKNREYRERIRQVEHADFNPLVVTTAGGMAPQCHLVVIRTTLMCLRGTRRKRQIVDTNIELAVSDGRMAD